MLTVSALEAMWSFCIASTRAEGVGGGDAMAGISDGLPVGFVVGISNGFIVGFIVSQAAAEAVLYRKVSFAVLWL